MEERKMVQVLKSNEKSFAQYVLDRGFACSYKHISVGDMGEDFVEYLDGGRRVPGNGPYDYITGKGTKVQIKTCTLREYYLSLLDNQYRFRASWQGGGIRKPNSDYQALVLIALQKGCAPDAPPVAHIFFLERFRVDLLIDTCGAPSKSWHVTAGSKKRWQRAVLASRITERQLCDIDVLLQRQRRRFWVSTDGIRRPYLPVSRTAPEQTWTAM